MEKDLRKQFFDLEVFFLTSARQLIDGTQTHGPVRMLRALRRLIELQEMIPGLGANPFLDSIKDKLDKREYAPTSSLSTPEGLESLKSYLDGLIVEFAREAKRRQASATDTT